MLAKWDLKTGKVRKSMVELRRWKYRARLRVAAVLIGLERKMKT